MNYIDENSKRIITIHEVRRVNPDKSLPDGRDYPDLGYRFIFPTEKPSALPNHIVEEDFPEEVNGKWVQVWKQVELPPASPYIPQQVTRAQGKAALITSGLWSDVESYVDSITDPTEKALALVALNDTTHWQRSSPFLNSAATALGLSSEDLDNLFIQADSIEL